MIQKDKLGNLFFLPSREEIKSVEVGSVLPDCFGRMSRVVDITYRGIDIYGRAYVGVYLSFGEDGKISASYKEGKLFRTLPLSHCYRSHELDMIEERMNAQAEADSKAKRKAL